MARCRLCRQDSPFISARLGYCASCIRKEFETVWPELARLHAHSRQAFNLPENPPQHPEGKTCTFCFHACRIPPGGRGFCGVRQREGDHLRGGTAAGTGVSWYEDPLPTNCVAAWFCPAGTGCGYPRYARRPGPERGYVNLAVFYHGCNFNCLYCQNWDFRLRQQRSRPVPAAAVAAAVGPRTACICYFGGDPTPHLPHALAVSWQALAAARREGRLLRICWETNGGMSPAWLRPLVESSLDNGGVIKFDLKAWSREIHLALTGVDNRQTLENFATLATYLAERPEVPLLTASTLLVPGYIEAEEVAAIAGFIARLNKDIPYSLLAFYPCFYLTDLPCTPRRLAEAALAAARDAGLTQVRLGNVHLLTG